MGTFTEAEFTECGKRCLKYYSSGEYAMVIQECNRLLMMAPVFYPAYLQRGNSYLELGKYNEARNDFNKLLQIYSPSDKDLPELKEYAKEGLAKIESKTKATEAEIKQLQKRIFELKKVRERIAKYQACVSADYGYTIGLKTDGTVVVAGEKKYGKCYVRGWRNIVAVATGEKHTVGLKADGTVVAVGNNRYGKCNVSGWRDIVAIASSYSHTVGLKADGTVVAVGYNKDGQCNVSGWRDIIAVTADFHHTVGLKADGTVVAVGYNKDGQCNVSGWRDIVAVSASYYHTVGLKADGTVVAVGNNEYGQCNVGDWRDIVAVSAGSVYTIGLKADGTVIDVSNNKYHNKGNISGWRDIIAVSARAHTVGIKADGTVVAVGHNEYGQCNVLKWQNIGPASEEQVLKWKQSLNWKEQGLCEYCGGKLKSGFLSKKCLSCGKKE